MKLFCIIIFLFYIGTIQTSIYGNIENAVYKFLRRNFRDGRASMNDIAHEQKSSVPLYLRAKNYEVSDTKHNAEVSRKARRHEEHLNHGQNKLWPKLTDPKIGKEYYQTNPVLNHVKRRNRQFQINARRGVQEDSSEVSSSEIETNNWKEDFNDQWLMKKFEAVNSTDVRDDVVNMVAARPWGVPCGDPNQHDMPWGTCMLASECDSEYRIYRGDSFCGRTKFVCCALQLTNYDLYQGFDVSFAGSSFSTDSAERKNRELGSGNTKTKKNERAKTKRKKERKRRKRQMKKNIRRIVHEIRKILNRSFRNATHHRRKRTKLLKKYIRDLKKQYKKDRKSVRQIHANDMVKVDETLLQRLEHIKDLNKNFLTNDTFRDIVVNGTISKRGARMLAQAYPELKKYLGGQLRRDGTGLADMETNELNDYLEYDIEYGALYY